MCVSPQPLPFFVHFVFIVLFGYGGGGNSKKEINESTRLTYIQRQLDESTTLRPTTEDVKGKVGVRFQFLRWRRTMHVLQNETKYKKRAKCQINEDVHNGSVCTQKKTYT